MPAENLALSPEIASQPTVEEHFNSWNDRLSRLEAELNDNGGLDKYPAWWREENDRRHLARQLKTEDASPAEVANYLGLSCRESEIDRKINNYKYSDSLFYQVATDLGVDVVSRAFLNEKEDGILHQTMLTSLENSKDKTVRAPRSELQILKQVYGVDKLTDLFGVKGGYGDELHSHLLNEQVVELVSFEDREHKEGEVWADMQASSRDWIADAIAASSGVSRKEAMDYAFSASRKCGDKKVIDIIERFDYFGAERVRKITEFTGILGLENYSISQLERMEKLADNPDEMAEKLKNHDVNLAMINTVGDYNGVMAGTASDFDDETGRTLFFEIASAGDVLKYLSKVNKCGIKPSTLVLSAHGLPGKFFIADERIKDLPRQDVIAIAGRRLVEMANKTTNVEGIKAHSMNNMKGVARALESYMQPSRGIDDDADSLGRKKIIFQTCHSGVETAQRNLDENNQEIHGNEESVVSQLAKDLLDSGIKSNIDIYGAPSSVQMHRTKVGVRYSGHPVNGERSKLHAVRVRLENGQINKNQVDEITLRK